MAEAIVVKTQRIVVYPPRGKIDIFGFGPTGPPGPPGPPGSGATIAWPIVAPANSTGNITFTPSNTLNDIRGLQTPDAASWIRFWTNPPGAVWLRANSGPLTGGNIGQLIYDADRQDFRDSPGTATLLTLSKLGHTFYGSLTMAPMPNSGDTSITISPSAATPSDRAAIAIGDWMIGQDFNQTGSRDLFFWNTPMGANRMLFPAGINEIRLPVVGEYFSWWNGGTRIGYLQGNADQIYLNGDGAGVSVRIRGGSGLFLDNGIGNYPVNAGIVGSAVVIRTPEGYINTNYFNTTANTQGACTWVAGQSSNDNYIRWCNAVTLAGQIQSTKQNNGATYYDQGFYSNSNGVGAAQGYGLHPGGVAGSIRMGINSGQWHFNNVDGSGYYPLAASGYNVASHPRFKSGVIDLVHRVRPIDVVRHLRPVWFQVPGDMLEPMELWDFVDGMDMNDGKIPNKEAFRKEVRMIDHDCDTSPHCQGTSIDPCPRKRDFDRGRIGFMADEIEQLFPMISVYGMKGELLGYDLNGLVCLLVAAVQNLSDEVNQLRMEAA